MGRRSIISIGAVCCGLIVAGCNEEFLSRWRTNFQRELAAGREEQVCGDGNNLAALVSDCPMPGVCFSDACAEHDLCYAFCEQTRQECDLSLYRGMTAICHETFPFGDPNQRQCLYFALAYFAAVDAFGAEVFHCDGSPPPSAIGACCVPGAQCIEGMIADCPEHAITFPSQSCSVLDLVFGGCPTPANDDCDDALEVCAGQSPAQGAGQCVGSDSSDDVRVCEFASPSCPDQESCLPAESDVYFCTVVGDNRLATTDGGDPGAACGFELPGSFQADVWFRYRAPCSGVLSVSMCRGTQYDATLAVYGRGDSPCDCAFELPAAPLACDDDGCGGFATGSALSIPVAAGTCNLIRVGGWSSSLEESGAARGVFQLDIGVICESEQ